MPQAQSTQSGSARGPRALGCDSAALGATAYGARRRDRSSAAAETGATGETAADGYQLHQIGIRCT